MKEVAKGGGPYGEVSWIHQIPQAAQAYVSAIQSITSEELSTAGKRPSNPVLLKKQYAQNFV